MTDAAAWKPGEFAGWVENADRDELLPVLCALTDADRRQFSKEVSAAWKKVRDQFHGHENLKLTVLAVCPWTQVKSANARFFTWQADGHRDIARDIVKVLGTRRPDWIDQFVAQELEKDWPRWSLVRSLVREGVCERPSSDNYIISMVRTNFGREGTSESLLSRIKDDPAVLEDEIWRIFEIDVVRGQLFYSDEASWRDETHQSWGPALIALVNDRSIDRRRLLDAAHETLRRGLQLKDTGFHMRLIERLEPTAQELVQLRDVYLDLLSHRVDAVVRFALAQCDALLKNGDLEPAVILDRIGPALQREKKAPAEAALKLIRKIVKSDRSLGENAARAAMEGLRHPLPDIHEKALDLIEELGAPPDLAEYVDEVAPSQRARAGKLVPSMATGSTSSSGDLELFVTRARKLDAGTRSLYAIDSLLDAIEKQEEPPRYAPSPSVPRLDEAKAVVPVRDFTEMVDLMLLVMETQPAAVDVERALDAFSRLAVDPPFDYRARTGALLQRTTQHASGAGDWSIVGTHIMRLVQLWLRGSSAHSPQSAPEEFLGLRVDEIVKRVRKKRAMTLLALPTHGTWIDPRVLVDRVKAHEQASVPLGTCDLVQALLRLAPEHRAEALEAARSLDSDEAAVVRYALGGDDELRRNPSLLGRLLGSAANGDVAWQLRAAAFRAREPFGTDESARNTPAAGFAFGVAPAKYTWRVRGDTRTYRTAVEYFVDVEWPHSESQDAGWPLSLFGEKARRWIFAAAADVRHRQSIWPVDPTPTFVAGVHSIVDRMFRPASGYTPTAPYLEPLLDPNVAVSSLAQVALALALVAQDADARTMAIDAAIEAIADGRLLGSELGNVYAQMMSTDGFIKLGRIAEAVDSIARTSVVHQLACARLLEEVLSWVTPPGPRDLHHLLAVYRELLAATNRSADPRLAALTASASGTGKGATLLKEIGKAEGTRGIPPEAYAALLARRTALISR